MASLASGHCEQFESDLEDLSGRDPYSSVLSHSALAMLQSTFICHIFSATPEQDKEAVSGISSQGSKIVFLLQSQRIHPIHILPHKAAKHIS